MKLYTFSKIFFAAVLVAISVLGCNPGTQLGVLNGVMEKRDLYYEEVPFVSVNGKFIIEAIINGQSKRFIFDTGSPNIITESLFYDLNENIIGETKLSDDFDNSKAHIVCEINSLRLGESTFEKVPTLVVDDSNPIFDCYKVDGVIGSNMFRNSIIHIDKQHGAVIVTNEISNFDNLNFSAGIDFELDEASTAPMVMLNVNTKAKVRAIFDTGNNGFLSLSNEHMQKLQEFSIVSETESAYGYHPNIDIYGSARPANFQRCKVDKLGVGAMDFYNLVLGSLGSVDKARLGTEILDYATVTVDYRKRKMYIQPVDKSLDVMVNHKRWPVTAAYFNGNRRISLVWKSGFAHLKDQILIGEGEIAFPEGYCNYVTKQLNSELKDSQLLITRKDEGDMLKTKIFPY